MADSSISTEMPGVALTPAGSLVFHSESTGQPAHYNWSGEFEQLLKDIMRVHTAKANDYTGKAADPLFNYRVSAMAAGCSTHQVMLARIQEKVTRLASLLRRGVTREVVDESEEDTLLDIANIALLILNDKRRIAHEFRLGFDPNADFYTTIKDRVNV